MNFSLINESRARAEMWALLLLALSLGPTGFAQSNIDTQHALAWGANVGWCNWLPDSEHGVQIRQSIGSGYIYSANVGWINLGNGSPFDQSSYSNGSPSDFGVNLDAAGNLRGDAYGANVGWIRFEPIGAPRVDLNTGKLAGFAYGANIGWINLGDTTFFVAIDQIRTEGDSDGDGIPDAWELTYAGDLTTFSATGDFDQDGRTDLQEYLDDTNPRDPLDFLHILQSVLSHDQLAITWASKTTRQYLVETRTSFGPDQSWADSGLGLQAADGLVTTRVVPLTGDHAFFRVRSVRPAQP